jgi:hypothetical protein
MKKSNLMLSKKVYISCCQINRVCHSVSASALVRLGLTLVAQQQGMHVASGEKEGVHDQVESSMLHSRRWVDRGRDETNHRPPPVTIPQESQACSRPSPNPNTTFLIG